MEVLQSKRFSFNYYCFSENGPRDENEDRILAKSLGESRNIFLVTDGIGGYKNGDKAAELALEIFQQKLSINCKVTKELILEVFNISSKEVSSIYPDSGCTLAGILTDDDDLFFFWMGDSKIFIQENDQSIFISKDHNLLTLLQEANVLIKPEELNRLENTLSRAIGYHGKEVLPDVGSLKITNGLRFIICSDGVSKVNKNKNLLTAIPQIREQQSYIDSIETNCRLNSKDNYSSIVVWIDQEL